MVSLPDWAQHAWLNRLQSLLLLAVMFGIVLAVGVLLFGPDGAWGLVLGLVLVLVFNPRISPRWVMRWYRARPIEPAEAPALYAALDELCARAGLPSRPRLYYLPSRLVNAFAVGHPGNSAIALTDGLLRRLNLRELTAVLAHEVSHIRNNDLWVMGLADLFGRLTAAMSGFGVMLLFFSLPAVLLGAGLPNPLAVALLIFSPTLSLLAQLGLSRVREYHADLNAVWLTRDPLALVRALEKIEHAGNALWERLLLPGPRLPEPAWLRTHPPTEARIRRILEVARVLPESSPMVDEEPAWRGGPPPDPPRWRLNGLWY